MKSNDNFTNNYFHMNSRCYQHLLDRTAKGLQHGKANGKVEFSKDLTIGTLSRNPCLLMKIASYFDTSSIRWIVSKQLIDLKDSLNSCKGLFGVSMRKSVAYIKGDMNSFDHLRTNAKQLLDRDTRFYILLCSQVCTNFILYIADTMGFGIGIYFWITLNSTPLIYEMSFPQNLMFIEFIYQSDNIVGSRTKNLKNSDTNPIRGYVISNSASSEKEEVLMDLIRIDGNGTFSINYRHTPSNKNTTVTKEVVLKVAIKINVIANSKPDLFDPMDMKCEHGMLCMVYNPRNGSLRNKREPSCCLGFPIDILSKLRDDLKINFHIYEVEDGLWGAQVNETWNGLIGDIASGRADMAANLLTASEERMKVVDFTDFIKPEDVVLVCNVDLVPLPYLNLEAFRALTLNLWMSLIIITLFTGGIILWAEKMIYFHSTLVSGCNIITYALGLLLQRDIGGLLPKNLGSRLVSITLALGLIIIMSTYTAVLITRNIETSIKFPISGMNDPKVTNPTPAFKIATYKSGFISSMFKRRDQLKTLSKFMEPYNFLSLAEAHEQLKKGNLGMIIIERKAFDMGRADAQYCDTQVLESIYQKTSAFAIRKGSPWNEAISNLISKYKDSGLMNNLENKYIASKCTHNIEHLPRQFGILYLSGACILLVFGVLLCIVFLCIEHFVYSIFKKWTKIQSLSINPSSDDRVRDIEDS